MKLSYKSSIEVSIPESSFLLGVISYDVDKGWIYKDNNDSNNDSKYFESLVDCQSNIENYLEVRKVEDINT